jgi:large subunit ribosomal protein L25
MEALLEATARETLGKNEARRTRRGGRVPAVVYGSSGEAAGAQGKTGTPISVDPKALLKILHSEAGANTLIALKLAGAGDARVLIKEYQLDPVTHQILHADFYRIAMDRVLRVTVPIMAKGEAPGVKQQGGIVEFVHRIIEVECLPADIPEHIEVNIGELMLHQGVRVRDIPVNPKWKPVSDADMMLVHVIMPKEEVVAPVADAAAVAAAPTAPAEPEVIKKGKKDEATGEKDEKAEKAEKKEDKKK